MRSVPGFVALCICAGLLQAASAPSAKVTQHMVLLEPQEDQLVVRESLIVHNDGNSAFTDPANGAVRIYVPDAGVSSLGVAAVSPGSSTPVDQKAARAGRQTYKVDISLPPGDTRFDFSYSLPFKSPGVFSGRVLEKDYQANLVVPQGVSLKGEGVQLVGQEPTTKASIYSIKAPQFKVEIEGAGSMAASGTADEQEGKSSLDEILPRVYDQVYAILGLAFGVLALGFTLLYRMGSAPASSGAKVRNSG